jgi:DHA1 family bicyclomycin/chloramphenicol resistance-like MFS transporter
MARPESFALFVLIIAVVAIGPASTDVYLPALPAIGVAFASDAAQVQLTLSVFLAAFALAMLVYGPLSDRFGRRPVLLSAITLYLAATLLCALAWSIEVLIAARFLQALGACAGPVIGRAVVRDVYGPERSAKVLSYVAMAMALAPALGPIFGGYLTVAFGWQSNFVLLVIYGLACLIGAFLVLPETNAYKDPSATQPLRLVRNYLGLVKHRSYLGYVLVCTGGYAGIFSFISGSSFALIDGVGLTPDAYGYCFAAAVVGYIAGSFANSRLLARYRLDDLILAGAACALLAAAIGALLAFAGVATVVSIVAPAAGFFLGVGMILPNGMAGAIGPYPQMAGAASALLLFVQMGGGALFGIAVGQLQDGSPRAMAAAMAVSAALAALAHRGLVLPAARRAGED